ncbi:MAG: cation:proton antiporter, partial [Candidatus Hydrothermota bacterium]
MKGVLPTALLTFIVYVVFTGSIKPFDLATGLVVALVIGF